MAGKASEEAMKRWTRERMRTLTSIVSTAVLVSMSAAAMGQGAPDVVWRRPGYLGDPLSVRTSPNGAYIAAGDLGGGASIWNVADGSIVSQWSIGGFIPEVAFSPDSAYLATAGGSTHSVALWSVPTAAFVRTIYATGGWGVSTVAYSPVGDLFAAGSDNRHAPIFDANTWAQVGDILPHGDTVYTMVFTPDGHYLAIAGGASNLNVELYHVPDCTLVWSGSGHTDQIRGLSISPDGALIASSGYEGTIRLWNAADGTPVRTLTGHTGNIDRTAFSPDGKTLLSGSYDGTIRLWSVTDGSLIRIYDTRAHGMGEGITCVEFTRDGRYFAYGSWDFAYGSGGHVTLCKVDTTPPVSTVSRSGTAGSNGWYTGTVQVTLSATDPDGPADVAATYYAIDGGPTQTYSSAFNVSGEGAHSVSFWSVDHAGNTEAAQTLALRIDSVAPATTQSLSGTLGNNGWYRSAVNVTLTATDATSGVAQTFYSVDGGPMLVYSGSFSVSGDGAHSVVFWSVDQAGNVEAIHSQVINIDATSPVLTAAANPSMLWPPNGKMLNITISGKVADSLSGVDTGSGTYTTVDSYGQVHPAGSFTIAANGTYSFTIQLEAKRNGQDKDGRIYTITINASDLAGNPCNATVTVTVPHDQR